MSAIASLDVPKIEGLTVEVKPGSLKLKGTITHHEPSRPLAGFFRALHVDTVQQRSPDFAVDVAELTFVNSSSIRLFIDWAVWIKGESSHRYLLKFRTSRSITWQQTAFQALASLMAEIVRVERA
jgi:hypothetical protein